MRNATRTRTQCRAIIIWKGMGRRRQGTLNQNLKFKLLTLKRHTCLTYAARIRGAVLQEHCVVSYLLRIGPRLSTLVIISIHPVTPSITTIHRHLASLKPSLVISAPPTHTSAPLMIFIKLHERRGRCMPPISTYSSPHTSPNSSRAF